MTYKAYHFAGFLAGAALLTAAAYLGIPWGVEPYLADPKGVHDFFFNRSAIQWVTVGTFFFAMAIVTQRLGYQAFLWAGLRRLSVHQSPDSLRQSLGERGVAAVVAARFEALLGCAKTRGAGTAAAYARELAARDEEEVARIYGLLGNAVQLMLALGFLGTVWGISRSLFGSFGVLSGASIEQLKAGLEGFTVGLSTALDTSVLGLVCGLVTTVTMSAVQWAETTALGSLDRLVCARLALDGRGAGEGTLAPAVGAELAKVVASLARDTQAAMTEIVARSAAAYETKIAEAFQRQLGQLGERERQLFETAAAALGREMGTAIRALEDHSKRLRLVLSDKLARLADDLHRAPEVHIRYPNASGNGDARPAPAIQSQGA